MFFALLLLAMVWPEQRVLEDGTMPLGGPLSFCVAFLALAGALVSGAVLTARPRRWSVVAVAVGLGGGLVALAARLPSPWAELGGGLGLVGAALPLGGRLGAEVQRASYLWPLAVVALGADMWSVTTPEGVTSQLVESGPQGFLGYVVLAVPVAGVGVEPVLGIGDVLFSALLVGAVVHLGLPVRRMFWGLMLGFSLCLLGLLVIQLPIPALPFIAVAGVGALGRDARPVLRELGAAVIFVAGFFLVRSLLL